MKSQRELALEAEIIKYRDALAVATNTGENVGRLSHNLGQSLKDLGDLNAIDNRTAATRNYIQSSDAFFSALKDRTYVTGETVGELERDLEYSLRKLDDLNVIDNLRHTLRKHGDVNVSDNLGHLLRKLGDLYVKDNPEDAKRYYKVSIEVRRRELRESTSATSKMAERLNASLGHSLRQLGDLNVKDNRKTAGMNYAESIDAFISAINHHTSATGKTAGRLESNLGHSLRKLGDLNVKNNADAAKQNYEDSSNAYNRALEDKTYARGNIAGKINNDLGYLLHKLGNLNVSKNHAEAERYYTKSSEAYSRALAVDEYATGTTAGLLQENLGVSLLNLGDLTKDPADAEQYYTKSSEAFNHALEEPAYANSKIRRRVLNGYLKDSNNGLRRAQSEIKKGEREGRESGFKRVRERIGHFLSSAPDKNQVEDQAHDSDSDASLDDDMEPNDAIGARIGPNKLEKLSEDHKKWEGILKKTTPSRSLTLSPVDADIFKKIAFDDPILDRKPGIVIRKLLQDVRSLTIQGDEGQAYDLRNVTDLGERLGNFTLLRVVEFLNCKIDSLNIDALPDSLHTVDLTDSVVPLPLQERLKGHFKDRRDRVGKGTVILNDRDEQIENYENGALEDWIQEGASVPGSKRPRAGQKTLGYLEAETNPGSLVVRGYKVGKFDDDFYAMIASNELTDLNMSGNNLDELDLAKVALSPNLQIARFNDNNISRVHNAQSLAQLDSLQTLEMMNNQLTRIPDGIEYAPEASTVHLEGNELSSFAKIDAKLIKFSKVRGAEMRDHYLREQRGPTVVTDPMLIISGERQLGSREFTFEILDDLDKKHASIEQVERELDEVGADASSRARWREVGELFEKHAYAEALEVVITNPGGPFKVGRNERYHQSAEKAVRIAGERAMTLHPLPGHSDLKAGPFPGGKDAYALAQGIAGGAKIIPVPVVADAVGGVAQAVNMGIDLVSANYFEKFHRNLLKMFRPSELQMLRRVIPFAMTMTMGEHLELDTVRKGKPRETEPSEKILEIFKRITGTKIDAKEKIESRAFHDAAYLMDDIASGAAYGIPNNNKDNEKKLLKKLEGMTFQQKVEEPLAYWAKKENNCGKETLPFKKRYVLCDSPLDQQLAVIAKNYTLNDLEQRKEIRGLKSEVEELQDKLKKERLSRRNTTKLLIASNLFKGLTLSDSEPETEKVDREGALPLTSSVHAERASEEEVFTLENKEKQPAISRVGASATPRAEDTRRLLAQAAPRYLSSRERSRTPDAQQGRRERNA